MNQPNLLEAELERISTITLDQARKLCVRHEVDVMDYVASNPAANPHAIKINHILQWMGY